MTASTMGRRSTTASNDASSELPSSSVSTVRAGCSGGGGHRVERRAGPPSAGRRAVDGEDPDRRCRLGAHSELVLGRSR